MLIIIFSIKLVLFTIIYKPFISIDPVSNDRAAKFFYISKNTLTRYLPINQIDPSYIYFPNPFSSSYTSDFGIINNDYSSLTYPPELYIHESLFLNNYFEHNVSFQNNTFIFPYNRRPFSTLGTLKQKHISQNLTYKLQFRISSLTDAVPMIIDQMPSDFSKFFDGKIIEPAELFFHIYNNFIFGVPTISKTTGNEELDSMISSYLKSFVPSMNLPDGYYRFALPP